ncbi:MAG: glycosyltransferase, partial [Acidobacteriota bacterium]
AAAHAGPASPTPQEIASRLAAVQEVFAQVRLFVAPSRALGEGLTSLGLPEEKLQVSDYGFAPLPPAAARRAEPRLRIGFVGTLCWHKGAHVLLEAVRHLPADRFRVLLHGGTDTFPDYTARLRELAAGLPVEICGGFDRDRVAEIYHERDLLVVPSLWAENSPLVIHEAFMAGLPVVGARTGGIPELVTNEQNGLLYEPFSALDLAAALRRLIEQPELLERFRGALPAVKTIAEDAAEWEGRYREVLDQEPAGASRALELSPPPATRSRSWIVDRGSRFEDGPEPSRPPAARSLGEIEPGAVDSPAPGAPPPEAGGGRSPASEMPATAATGREGAAAEVSVVIPTFNGVATLSHLLTALERQQTQLAWETVAVDSGSTDGTLALLDGRVSRVLRVPRAEFDHGLTRNLGIREARGELVVLLVQDAIPASPDWLEQLARPLLEDPALAGTFARQLPRPDASRLTRHNLARWVAAGEEPRTSRVSGTAAFDALTPLERLELCAFDDVCSCIRRSVWEIHPIPQAAFAEDIDWAREVLLAGHALAFIPAAAVVHSHERSARYELARTRAGHYRLYELLGLRTIPTLRHLLRSFAVTLADHLRCLRVGEGPRPGPREVARALALAFAWPLGQYLGARAAARGQSLAGRGQV